MLRYDRVRAARPTPMRSVQGHRICARVIVELTFKAGVWPAPPTLQLLSVKVRHGCTCRGEALPIYTLTVSATFTPPNAGCGCLFTLNKGGENNKNRVGQTATIWTLGVHKVSGILVDRAESKIEYLTQNLGSICHTPGTVCCSGSLLRGD